MVARSSAHRAATVRPMTRTSVRSAAVRVLHVRLRVAQVARPLHRVRRVGLRRRVGAGARGRRAGLGGGLRGGADADRRGPTAGARRSAPPRCAELDRVLGGGLVAGSVTLVGGEPGMGKSTLVLQALGAMAARGARCLLVCAEESAAQVRHARRPAGHARARAVRRVGNVAAGRRARTSRPCEPGGARDRLDPGRARSRRPGAAGSVTQVRDGAQALVSGSPRSTTSRRCSSATSPRTVGSRARARSSTSSTPCSRSRAIATTRCACCAR